MQRTAAHKGSGNTANLIDTEIFSSAPRETFMTTCKAATTESYRASSHRYSALPVKDVLRTRMKDLNLKNVDLQKALDYPFPNVIAMMRSGAMRLPANKVIVIAQLLQVDPIFLLGKVIAENDPALWDVISTLLGKQLVTGNELALITWVRQGLDGHDINLAASPGLTRVITPHLVAMAERETAKVQATIRRKDK